MREGVEGQHPPLASDERKEALSHNVPARWEGAGGVFGMAEVRKAPRKSQMRRFGMWG